MHLFKRHEVRDYQAVARQIPVIGYGPFFAGLPGARERVAAEAGHACEHVGFFYALNHGVPETLIDRAFAASRRFHALRIEEKIRLRLNENNIGYLPINASVQGASTVHKATKPHQNESFFVSHDRPVDLPAGGLPRSGPRILSGQLLPPERPPLRSCFPSRSGPPFGGGIRSGRGLSIQG
jgi:hypothetical protein